jgi:hypothetical protein
MAHKLREDKKLSVENGSVRAPRMTGLSTANLSALALASTLLCLLYAIAHRRKLPYAPGPKGYPLFGSIFTDFGPQKWVTYRDISTKIGTDKT